MKKDRRIYMVWLAGPKWASLDRNVYVTADDRGVFANRRPFKYGLFRTHDKEKARMFRDEMAKRCPWCIYHVVSPRPGTEHAHV